MRKSIGIICVLIGTLCIVSSVGFIAYNRWEAGNAEKTTKTLLHNVKSIINEEPSLTNDMKMATIKVDGYDCIGILSLPALDIELPVLSDWSYAKLKKAPCLYYGSYFEKDFVIAAHNYNAHFGRLSNLQQDDMVVFTDVNGKAHYYKVVLLETLPKNATKEMITSGFDLSLYTCTPGGSNRVTVRCNVVQNSN